MKYPLIFHGVFMDISFLSVHRLSMIFISLGGTNETLKIHWFEGYFKSIFHTFWFGSDPA